MDCLDDYVIRPLCQATKGFIGQLPADNRNGGLCSDLELNVRAMILSSVCVCVNGGNGGLCFQCTDLDENS